MSDNLNEDQLRALDELNADYEVVRDEDPEAWEEMKREAAVWDTAQFMCLPDDQGH